MKTTLPILTLCALLLGAHAQTTTQEWQAKAVEKYPELGVQGSALNKQFLDAHARRLKDSPAFFSDPQWPMKLADELATSEPKPAPAARHETPIAGTAIDATSRGVLGMTEAEARMKYGTPVVEIKPGNPVLTQMAPAELALTFEKNGIYIAAQFYQGKVAKVQYIRKDKQSFGKSEAEVLLSNNTNLRWVYLGDPGDGQQWDTADHSTVAINSTSQSLLSIVTRAYTKAITAASKSSLRGL